MDSISEARLHEVMPALADKISQLASQLAVEHIIFRVTQALRTWVAQDKLYAQGRAMPGPIVTNVPGGYSWHNFGCAIDLVPMGMENHNGVIAPDWNAEHPVWKRIVSVGLSLGLTSGATWRTFKDYPHFQMTGRFPEDAPDDEVRQLFKDGGCLAVWNEICPSASA